MEKSGSNGRTVTVVMMGVIRLHEWVEKNVKENELG